MALETTKTGRTYYYRGRRDGDRVIRVYIGAGDVAHAAAEHDERRRAQIAAVRRSIDDMHQAIEKQLRPVRDANNYIGHACDAILLDAGFHRHDRGPWLRKKGKVEMIKPTSAKPTKLPTQEEFKSVTDQANAGDSKALARLRQLLDDNPAIWRSLGDLPRYAREAMLATIAGKDESVRESLRRSADELLQRLTKESSSAIEKLAADRIVANWLECHFVDMLNPLPQGATIKQQRFHMQLKSSAQRRYDASLRSLATLKKLLAPEPEPTPTKSTKKAATRLDTQPTIQQCDPYHNRIAIFNEVDDERESMAVAGE